MTTSSCFKHFCLEVPRARNLNFWTHARIHHYILDVVDMFMNGWKDFKTTKAGSIGLFYRKFSLPAVPTIHLKGCWKAQSLKVYTHHRKAAAVLGYGLRRRNSWGVCAQFSALWCVCVPLDNCLAAAGNENLRPPFCLVILHYILQLYY